MVTVGSYLAFALALLVVAATPGPSIAALVSRVITSGVRDVLPFLAAMWIGEALWLTAAATGLSAVARAFNTGFEIAKCAGVAYLLYLAWKMWTAPTTFEQGVLPLRQHPLKMFGAGIAVTLGNPKIMLFYAALPADSDQRATRLGRRLGTARHHPHPRTRIDRPDLVTRGVSGSQAHHQPSRR